jgi:pyruvate formate lyase activating enzyme
MLRGNIFDIKRFAVYDGPGIRTTVFMKGCTLRCAWCHNPEGQVDNNSLYYNKDKCIDCNLCVDICPVDKIQINKELRFLAIPCQKGCINCFQVCPSMAIEKVGHHYSIEEIMNVIYHDMDFFSISGGGVTLSGGEPLVQIDFVEALARRLSEDNISLVVETCGNIDWNHFERMLPYVDTFYYDLKVSNNNRHEIMTGEGNQQIVSNFSMLVHKAKSVIVRVPLIPGYTDTLENIDGIIDAINSVKNSCTNCDIPVELLPYNMLAVTKYGRVGINVSNIRPYALSKAERQSLEVFRSCKERFVRAGFKTVSILSYE